jgi:hypothetical protein
VPSPLVSPQSGTEGAVVRAGRGAVADAVEAVGAVQLCRAW